MKKMTGFITAACLLLMGPFPARSGSPLPSAKSGRFASNLQYTGGSGTGFTLEQVRWGDHHNFERIVLEFRGPGAMDSGVLPRIRVETEFYPLRLAIRLPGSSTVLKDPMSGPDLLEKSRLISGIHIFDDCGGGGQLTVNPARPVEFEVFTLASPARLVIDVMLSRMPPMREEERYSVRTFPLFGDQVCLLLEEAADAGVTPRLVTDADGNVFGELGLYSDPDEAFAAMRSLEPTLGKRFALTIRSRGMMDTPAVVP